MSYQPPANTYDQPFFYVFDASPLTDGKNALNQSISLDPGIGDFILRRAVGWSLATNKASNGAYLLKDYSKNPLAGGPLFVNSSGFPFDDGVYPREQFYPATGKIPFDLYNVLRANGTGPLQTAQIAFQGVRRQNGTLPNIRAPYRYTTKAFSYRSSVIINSTASANGMAAHLYQPISDYDFELQEVRIVYLNAAQLFLAVGEVALMLLVAKNPGISGNAISITIGTGATEPPNQAFSIQVSGFAIKVIPATDGAGAVTSTIFATVAALQADPAVTALVTITLESLFDGLLPTTSGIPRFLQGGNNGAGLPTIVTTMLLYDAVRFQTSNIPMNDIFLNRVGPYQNGAIVPALLYPISTSLHIDFYSQVADPTKVPLLANVEFVGRNRIPC